MPEPDRVPLEIRLLGWLTTSQVAAALGVSGKTIQNLCEAGILHSTRLNENGWRRIPVEDLERFATQKIIKPNWGAIVLKPDF